MQVGNYGDNTVLNQRPVSDLLSVVEVKAAANSSAGTASI